MKWVELWVVFGVLVECGLLCFGEELISLNGCYCVKVCVDGMLVGGDMKGLIY